MELSSRSFLSTPMFEGRFVGNVNSSYGPYGYVEATTKRRALCFAEAFIAKYSRARFNRAEWRFNWREFRFYWRVPIWSVNYD